MRLIRKAHSQGYLTQRCRTCHHQVAGFFQAASHDVGMWRLADRQFEFPGEVRRAATRERTEIADVNGAMQVAVNVGPYSNDLPGRQAAPCEVISARTTLDLRLQDMRSCGQ